jgi:signal transduction histidine kinase/CheY-like chemotaxis protein
MWQLRRILAGDRSESYADELFVSSSRSFVTIIAALYLGWHFFAAATWPSTIGKYMWPPTVCFVPLAACAYLLLPRHFFVAQFAWLSCLLVTVTVALITFQAPEIAVFYALLPLVAILTIGWPAAVVVEGSLALLLVWLARNGIVAGLHAPMSAVVLACGVLLGIVGWITIRTLFTTLQWALSSWAEAKRSEESAREHRAGLLELNIQLDRTNHQLDKANAALMAAWRTADEAERFKTEFVTNVSHEMRTPLNLIIGFSQMMVTSPESYGGKPLPGGYRSDLFTVYRSAQHLLALVDDVIDLARIDAGKIPLVRYEIDLGALVQETVEIVRKYIAAKGLELRVAVPRELPPVWADRQRIRQVLLNLLTNAARHTRTGYIGVEVQLQARNLNVQVKDTGPGIPPENQQWIFTQFHTTEQVNPEWHSGSGLGLPISKQLVTLHGGRMGVESQVGEGSCFWFTLPLDSEQDEAAWGSPGRREELVAEPSRAKRAVVLVHDNPGQITPLLRRHLEDCEVIGADSWGKAGDLVVATSPVTVLSECEPPAHYVRAAPHIRLPLPRTFDRAQVPGVRAFLRKPLARDELLTAVDTTASETGREVRRVLVVDNDPAMAQLLRRMLAGRVLPRNCVEAFDGEEALGAMRAEAPDLIILDLMMPTLDGYGVLQEMSRDPQLAAIPVILISAAEYDVQDVRLMGSIQIAHPHGFAFGEVIRIVQATLDVLEPGWTALQSSAPAHPAALRA